MGHCVINKDLGKLIRGIRENATGLLRFWPKEETYMFQTFGSQILLHLAIFQRRLCQRISTSKAFLVSFT